MSGASAAGAEGRFQRTSFLIAGGLVGLLGVVLFGLLHSIVIVPIWEMLFRGVPFALVAGIVMGWALHILCACRRAEPGVRVGLAFGLLLWATLLPMTLFALAIRAAGLRAPDSDWEVVVESLLAFGAGALAGRAIAGRWRAALPVGIASLALTFTQAGPVPLMNGARAAWLFAGLSLIYPLCGLVLAVLASRMTGLLQPRNAARPPA